MRPPRKIGAPPKRDPRPGERFQLGVRVTPQAKRVLEKAARTNGRSLSQEAELRLEKSFDRNDLLLEALSSAFGKEAAGLLLMLGLVMLNAGLHQHWSQTDFLSDDDHGGWLDDAAAYEQGVRAINYILEAARPSGELPASKAEPRTSIKVSTDMIRALRWKKQPWRWLDPFSQPMADVIRTLLGPVCDRLKEPSEIRSLRGPEAPRMITAPACCSWCDQPLSPGQAEAIVARIGAKIYESNMDVLMRIIMPRLDAEVCSLCEQSIPLDKVQEIFGRARQLTMNLAKHSQTDVPVALSDFLQDRAKRLKSQGS